MRGRCETHQLALGPSGCLICRREQAASLTSTAARVPEVSAAAAGGKDSAEAAGPAQAPAGSAGPSAHPVREASATPTLEPAPLNIQISPWVLLVPAVALALYLANAVRSGIELERAERANGRARAAMAAPQPGAEVKAGPELLDGSRAPGPMRAAGRAPAQPELELEDSLERPSAALAGESERVQEPGRDTGAEQARQLAEARELVDVTVYYTTWCPACRAARGYLSERGIRFVEHDVEHDARAKARQKQLNPRGNIPTIDIEGQVLVGFNPTKIERAIEHAARQRLARQ